MSTRNVALVFGLVLLQAAFIKDTQGQTGTCQILDLAFVIDASGSICDSDSGFVFGRDKTCNNWAFVIEFIYQIVNSFVISPDTTRIAVITFATNAMLRWNLTAYPDKTSLLNAINNTLLYAPGGQTDTTGALNLLVTGVFGIPGDRPEVNNTAIIITDGKPTNNVTVPAAIQAVHNARIRTLVVGVTDQVDSNTLQLLSSPPQQENVTYFWAKDFKTIDQVRVQLTAQACQITIATIQSMAPTSAPMTMAQIACDLIDLCFIIDRSGSICDNDQNFLYPRDDTCGNWASIVNFIHGIAANLNIGPSNVRVALVIFANSAEVAWGLAAYTTKADLLNAIDKLQYIKGGTTDTTGGLNMANTQVFNTPDDRPNVANVAIIITDGKPTVQSTVPAAIQALQGGGCRTLVVGITDSIDINNLVLLSSPPKQAGVTYFMAANYSTVNMMTNSLQAQTCAQSTTTAQAILSCTDVQDVVIVLDGSGSICDSDANFLYTRDMTCNNWAFILLFLHNLIDKFTMGSAATRVALILFSNDARLVWGLDTYTDKFTLLYAIDNLQYVKGGTTNTTGALNVLNTQVFTPQLIRQNVVRTAIIITDGKPTVPSTVPAAINAVLTSGIRCLVVGVTNQVDNQTLRLLSSPPKIFGETYFMATDYQTIDDQVSAQLIASACPGTSTPTTTTTPTTTPTTTTTPSTTPSTTTTTPAPTSPSTSGTTTLFCTALLDLAFVVDGSGSICDTDPTFNPDRDITCTNWKNVLDFMHRIVLGLSIGLNQIRVGMIVFSSPGDTRVLWNLTAYTTTTTLLNAIDSIQYKKFLTTDTTGGLNLLRTVMFGGRDDRPNANNTAIIITDGKPSDITTVGGAIKAVHDASIRTFVVGITTSVDVPTLQLLSSPPQLPNVTYFTSPDFNSLDTVRNVLQTQTCGA